MIDTKAERAKLGALTGYTPGPWDASGLTVYDTCMDGVASCHAGADARIIAAAPDMKATLAIALDEIDRLRDILRTIVSRAQSAKHDCESGAPISAYNLASGILGQIGADVVALSGEGET